MERPYLYLNAKFMRFSSMQISEYKNKFEKFYMSLIRLLNYLIIITFLIQNFLHWYHLNEEFNFEKEAMNVVTIAIYSGYFIRLTFFIINSKRIMYVLKEMKKRFVNDVTLTDGSNINMARFKKISNRLCYFWQINVFITVSQPYIIPLILGGDRFMLHDIWYPTDWRTSNYYPLYMVHQCIADVLMGFTYANSDSFTFCNITLWSGQIQIVGHKFTNIFRTALNNCDKVDVALFNKHDELFNVDENVSQNDEILFHKLADFVKTKQFLRHLNDELNDCIRIHQGLKELSMYLNDFMSLLWLSQIMFAAFFMIITVYGSVTGSSKSALTVYSVYAVVTVVQLLILMSFGQFYINQYEKLPNCLYQLPWYLFDKSSMKTLNIMLMNVMKPDRLTAGKLVVLYLPTFISVLRSIMSYVTVLRQVTSNELL